MECSPRGILSWLTEATESLRHVPPGPYAEMVKLDECREVLDRALLQLTAVMPDVMGDPSSIPLTP